MLNHHILTIEQEEDSDPTEEEQDLWYTITYRISDGFQNRMVVDQQTLVSLYNLIGKALRGGGDGEENIEDNQKKKEKIWTATTVK